MEFILATLVLAFIFSVSGKGHKTLIKSESTWTLDNCKNGTFDLVFVADASVVDSYDQINPNRQMALFSQMIDVFSPPSEEKLDRLRVSLMIATKNSTTDASMMDLRIEFDSFTNKSDLKTQIENEKIEYVQISKPMDAFEYINVINNNNTINMVRADAILVIVMFGGHESENVSYALNYLREGMNKSLGVLDIKLFMIVVKDKPPSTLDIDDDIAVLKVPEINKDLFNTMSLLMCNECCVGWFGGKIERSTNVSEILTLTCYKLGHYERHLSWSEASTICWTDGFQLVSIETETKLLYLSEQMIPQFENIPMLETELDSCAIYIGLRRVYTTVGRRFRWANRNPLVYSNWGYLQPQGGLTRLCAMWMLSNVNDILKSIKDNRNETTLKGTWSTVGCGDAASRFYLCENSVKIKLTPQIWEFVLNDASDVDFRNAIVRGEVGFISKSRSLMSISALLKNWKSEDKLSDSYVYINVNTSQTIPLSDVNLYLCEGNDGNIPYTSVCDFSYDCPDRSDELFCRKCNGDESKCTFSEQCIPANSWCDLYNDCTDGVDEQECYTCKHGLCADGRCLLKHYFADGEIDCFECNSYDNITFEMNYVQHENILYCIFTCNRTDCVYEWMLNNSVIDCKGIEGPIDETVGALESTTCYTVLDNVTSLFSNWGPKCYYILDIYREPLGCRNMRHLLNCESFICQDGYYKCPQSYCIPTHYISDGFNDCPLGEDEDYDKYVLKCLNYFRCQYHSYPGNLGLCLHPNLVCDGRKDCPEGDDELNCRVSCPYGFRCLAGTVVVQDLKQIKRRLDLSIFGPQTRYLDLSGIDLSIQFPMAFLKDFIYLNNIKLSFCKIFTTDTPAAMCNLGTVRRIDLSYNNITNISSVSIFWCMRNLFFLNLSHNEFLTNFQNNRYNIRRLEILDLSYTGLSVLQWDTFAALDDIRYLNLKNTPIADLSFLPHTSIHELDLRGTPVNSIPYSGMFVHVVITTRLLTDSYKLCCPQLHNSSTNFSACFSSKDPFSSCSDLMSSTILRIILWIDGVLAVLGNMAVIIYRLFFDRNIFKMAYGHFVTHLGISDFLMGVYLLIIATADRLYRDVYLWQEHSWRYSTLCNIAGFLSTLSVEVSSFFIFLITLDRFLVIRYPFGQFRITRKIASILCAATWIIGTVIAILPLLPFFTYLNVYNTNSMCLGLPLTNNRQSGREFAISIFIFFNFVMFSLIAFGQIAIYKTVCVMRMNQGSLTNINCRRAQDLTLAKKLALIVVTEFVGWFPIGVLGIMTLCGYRTDEETYAWLAVLVLPINSAINPLLYTIPVLIQKVSSYAEKMSIERSKQQ